MLATMGNKESQFGNHSIVIDDWTAKLSLAVIQVRQTPTVIAMPIQPLLAVLQSLGRGHNAGLTDQSNTN